MLDRISLDGLAVRIEAEHHAVAAALRTALGHAIAAGEMLIEVKRRIRRNNEKWLPWLEANCSVPARTASHYMRLAKHAHQFCDENGNVLPISVREALGALKHPQEGGDGEAWGTYTPWRGWGVQGWGEFGEALCTVTRLPQLNLPACRYVVAAARAGKTPGLTATSLRDAAAILVRYAEAFERSVELQA